MASSYSTDLKLELMVTGENAGTWGDKTNTNLNLIQQAVAGYEAVALTDGGTVALAMSDAALSNARNMILKFTGTLTTASTVTIPNGIEKFYIIDLSAVTGVTNLTIKTVSGTGFTAGEAAIVAAYSDGTNLNEIALNTLGGTIAQAQIDDAAISTAKLSNNAVTTVKISNLNVTEAKLAASAVTADKIAQSTITQAKLASNSVGSDQLISTGVVAGSYAVATITVDADGRVTAASAGSAGGSPIHPTSVWGQVSGNYTANPAVTYTHVYLRGGGGGQGGTNYPDRVGGRGGRGGFGFWSIPVSHPFSAPYASGSGGNGAPPAYNGGAGGTSNFSAPGQNYAANGGSGGIYSNSGSTGPDGNPGSISGPGGINFTNNLDARESLPSDSNAGDGGYNPPPSGTGAGGEAGSIAIYDNE